MNNKFFVPFKTAKALKEAGYNEPTIFYYDSDDCGKELLAAPSYFCGYSNEQWNKPINGGGRYISAPTYHEVLDWLEGKGIYISVVAHFYFHTQAVEYYCHIASSIGDYPTKTYPTREEALNAAILARFD